MKKFQINSTLLFDMVMGIIMIPFLLVSGFIIGFALLLYFPYWKMKNKRKT